MLQKQRRGKNEAPDAALWVAPYFPPFPLSPLIAALPYSAGTGRKEYKDWLPDNQRRKYESTDNLPRNYDFQFPIRR